MSEHRAVVIGSTWGTNNYQRRLRLDICRDSVELFSKAISNLGPGHCFSLLGRRGYFIDSRFTTVRNSIEKSPEPRPGDVLLIYYYGHARISLDSICVLGFPEVGKDKQPSEAKEKRCSLGRLVECANARGYKRLVVVLDSCHSVRGIDSLRGVEGKWALLSSTGPDAQFEDQTSNPFTHEIVRVLTDADLRENIAAPGDISLSLTQLHKFVRDVVGGQQGLDPQLNGTLKEFSIAPVTVKLSPAVNEESPPKSLYMKLFRIAQFLGANKSSVAFSSLKSKLKGDPSFLITDAAGNRVFISDATLLDYMYIGELLGLWKASSDRAWIAVGTRRVDSYGSRFNQYIVKGVLKHLPAEADVAGIRRCVRDIMRQDYEPTYFRILRGLHDKYGPWQRELEPKYKRIMIRLLGYSRVLHRASSDTFFPR
ncbi:hypothetical protein ACFL5Z_05135 [Planctomycetota bacterium]